MHKGALLISFLLINLLAHAQNNILLLQKRGKTTQTFFQGKYISIQTVHGNYANGIITRIQQDSIYIRHFDIQQSFTEYGGIYFDTAFRYTTAVHYKDVGAILLQKNTQGAKRTGSLLMIAGGGVLALGAINGLYRGDAPRDWYKPSGYITAGALVGLGLLAKHGGKNKLKLGKKYTIKILPLDRR